MKETRLSSIGKSSLNHWASKGVPADKAAKSVLLSFQAGNALNRELMKEHTSTAKVFVSGAKELLRQAQEAKLAQRNQKEPEEDTLMAEVKNLSDFKPPGTREKTKLMVEQIILKKRELHLGSLRDFLEEVEQSYSSVESIEKSIRTDIMQFFKFNCKDAQDKVDSLNDQTLLSRDKAVLEEINNYIADNQARRKSKTEGVEESLLNLYAQLRARYKDMVIGLSDTFRDIAFVPQVEADQICQEQNTRLTDICVQSEARIRDFVDHTTTNEVTEFQQLKDQLLERGNRWKQLQKEAVLQAFATKLTDPLFLHTEGRTFLYNELKKNQQRFHKEREQLVDGLFRTPPPQLTKGKVEKWIQSVKAKNEQSNGSLDDLFSRLMQEISLTTSRGNKELDDLKSRLLYIEADDASGTEQILSEKCQPLIASNAEENKKLLSMATGYVEKYEARDTELCENIGKFMLGLGSKNDQHTKQLQQERQQYEIRKAKILDDDEEKVDKLNEELEETKKQLKEALHHPRLEEIQALCFQKVEELESHYRGTYEANKQLINQHPQLIDKYYDKVQMDLATMFHLFDLSRKGEFLQKVKENNIKLAIAEIEKEDAIRAEEELKTAEEIKKKGGKASALKPKDPKKAAAQLQERKQAFIKQLGPPTVNEIQLNQKSWIEEKEISQLSKEMYPQLNGESVAAVDEVEETILDSTGEAVVSSSVLIQLPFVQQKIESYRDKVFEHLGSSKEEVIKKEAETDKKYLSDSLEVLDERLKAHYPLKSIIESQIIGKRSSQIGGHKKRYERHARTARERVDEQTQKFNYLMEKSLEVTKTYTEQQKVIKEQLSNASNISNFQGISRKARESNDIFDTSIREIIRELKRLAESEIDVLVQKNQDFIKEIISSVDYSQEEVQWYSTMMDEISTQLHEQKDKRAQKVGEIEGHTKKKKEELTQLFDKDYAVGLEDMAAKDCSGRKYGRPKLIAQEKLRAEMNKCEKAQQNINIQMESLNKLLGEKGKSTDSLILRQLLMTLRVCIHKYAKHLEALKPEAKVPEMPRVNYDEARPDTLLLLSEKEEDEKRKTKEQQALGALSEQKEDKKYSVCIADINKLVKEQAQKIYVGDKAKFLNADKVPDNLEEYLYSIRKNAEGFRLNCIRDLRASCAEVSDLTLKISELLFSSIQQRSLTEQSTISNTQKAMLSKKRTENETLKTLHMKKLSPNLSNPASRKELLELEAQEKERLPGYRQFMKEVKDGLFDVLFNNASGFLNSVLNNFEFLILYYDSLYLNEDFIQLPGDETNTKNHLNIKQLMLLKDKKTTLDTSSERNLSKKWEGLALDVFDTDKRKFTFNKSEVEEPKDVKKGAKKETKDPKKEPQPLVQGLKTSKQIQSLKTFRQRSAFSERNLSYNQFLKAYTLLLQTFSSLFSEVSAEEASFEKKWNQMMETLKKAGE